MNKNLIEKVFKEGNPDIFGAIGETIKQEIYTDEEAYDRVGRFLLEAILNNNVEDTVMALCGWCIETLFEKARVIPDTKVKFYDSPLDANIASVDINGKEYFTPCKVNMQTFEVYDIQHEIVHENGDKVSNNAEIIEECIIFDDMEDYRFPLKPKDEVFGPNCYQDDEELDYSEITSYWYGENE